MGFPATVKAKVLVLCARHCCVCHKPKGLNIEVHHIIPQEQGGKNTIDNAIPLCFDCHADAGHYNVNHPKGTKLSVQELRLHRDSWYEIVVKNKITEPKESFAELTVKDNTGEIVFKPEFILETIRFEKRSYWQDLFTPLGKDFMEHFEQTRKEHAALFKDPHYDAIKTYDDYINFMNGDHIQLKKPKPYEGSQPFIFQFNHYLGEDKVFFSSNFPIELKFTNYGPVVFEDYKIYLHFEGVESVDSLDKRTKILDQHKYHYNVFPVEGNTLEFLPDRPVLVQNDSVYLDPICFRADHKAKKLLIRWELFARSIHLKGHLEFPMKPKIEKRPTIRYVEDNTGMRDISEIRPRVEFNKK